MIATKAKEPVVLSDAYHVISRLIDTEETTHIPTDVSRATCEQAHNAQLKIQELMKRYGRDTGVALGNASQKTLRVRLLILSRMLEGIETGLSDEDAEDNVREIRRSLAAFNHGVTELMDDILRRLPNGVMMPTPIAAQPSASAIPVQIKIDSFAQLLEAMTSIGVPEKVKEQIAAGEEFDPAAITDMPDFYRERLDGLLKSFKSFKSEFGNRVKAPKAGSTHSLFRVPLLVMSSPSIHADKLTRLGVEYKELIQPGLAPAPGDNMKEHSTHDAILMEGQWVVGVADDTLDTLDDAGQRDKNKIGNVHLEKGLPRTNTKLKSIKHPREEFLTNIAESAKSVTRQDMVIVNMERPFRTPGMQVSFYWLLSKRVFKGIQPLSLDYVGFPFEMPKELRQTLPRDLEKERRALQKDVDDRTHESQDRYRVLKARYEAELVNLRKLRSDMEELEQNIDFNIESIKGQVSLRTREDTTRAIAVQNGKKRDLKINMDGCEARRRALKHQMDVLADEITKVTDEERSKHFLKLSNDAVEDVAQREIEGKARLLELQKVMKSAKDDLSTELARLNAMLSRATSNTQKTNAQSAIKDAQAAFDITRTNILAEGSEIQKELRRLAKIKGAAKQRRTVLRKQG